MGLFGALGGAMGLGAFARGGSAVTGMGRGPDMPYTERQGDWDVTSGGLAGHMTRQNPQTGEQQYFDKMTGQWVSGPMIQQAPQGSAPDHWGTAPPLQTQGGPWNDPRWTDGTWGSGPSRADVPPQGSPGGLNAAALQQAAQAAYGMPGTGGLPYGQKPMMDANWAAYRGPGMLPLGFFGQGPAGWGGYRGSGATGLASGSAYRGSGAGGFWR